MAYVANNYLTNTKAPMESWVCTRTSGLGPFTYPATPPIDTRHSPDFCGQCVSFATTVCPTLPVNTGHWSKGALAKGNTTLVAGTVIATFADDGHYLGHTAIYHAQDNDGLVVFDQWITGHGKSIGRRTLRFGAQGVANDGDGFYVVE